MKKWQAGILFSCLLASQQSSAFVEKSDEECRMLGILAKQLVIDRKKGIPRASNISLARDAFSSRPIALNEIISVINLIYIDMPKLSPEGAYKLVTFACIADSDQAQKRK